MTQAPDAAHSPARDLAPARAPQRPALTPAEALHAALQWVTGAPAPAAPPAVAPASPSSAAGPATPATPRRELSPDASPARRAAAAPDVRTPALAPTPVERAPAPTSRPAPRALHIGSIEVEIQAPPEPTRHARAEASAISAPRTPVAPGSPLARGFTTPLGLRQG